MNTALCTNRENLFVVTGEMREWQERSDSLPVCEVCGFIHLFKPPCPHIALVPYTDPGPCLRCGRELCLGPGDCPRYTHQPKHADSEYKENGWYRQDEIIQRVIDSYTREAAIP